MKKRGNTLLAVILIIAIAAAAVAVGIGVSGFRNRQIYTQTIGTGDKYLATGDYDNAILMYQEAIRTDKSNEQGYIKLANVYIEQGYNTLAVGTLESGYENTKSERIQKMLLLYKNLDTTSSERSKEPVLNTSLLNKVEGTPFGEYVARNEIESVKTGASGEAIVRIKGVSADLVYRNLETLPAVVINGKVSENAYPTEIIFDNLTGLFGTSGIMSLEQFRTLEFNDVQLVEGGGTGYQLQLIYLGSTIVVPCDKDGNVNTESSCVLEPNLSGAEASKEEENEDGTTVMGTIEDAQSGYGIEGVTISIYEGQVTVVDPFAVVTTDSRGEYSVNLEPGNYTVIIACDGYVDVEKELYVGSYISEQEENYVLSAESSEEIRIVLEWDSPECDLDSYVTGGGNWLNFSNKEMVVDGKTVVSLDRDARSGHGVETTTIYDMEGSYEFFVFDYNISGKMQESGATVTIYVPGEAPQTISIPSDGGNTWYVCEVNAGKVSITNYMAEEQSSYAPK